MINHILISFRGSLIITWTVALRFEPQLHVSQSISHGIKINSVNNKYIYYLLCSFIISLVSVRIQWKCSVKHFNISVALVCRCFYKAKNAIYFASQYIGTTDNRPGQASCTPQTGKTPQSEYTLELCIFTIYVFVFTIYVFVFTIYVFISIMIILLLISCFIIWITLRVLAKDEKSPVVWLATR